MKRDGDVIIISLPKNRKKQHRSSQLASHGSRPGFFIIPAAVKFLKSLLNSYLRAFFSAFLFLGSLTKLGGHSGILSQCLSFLFPFTGLRAVDFSLDAQAPNNFQHVLESVPVDAPESH